MCPQTRGPMWPFLFTGLVLWLTKCKESCPSRINPLLLLRSSPRQSKALRLSKCVRSYPPARSTQKCWAQPKKLIRRLSLNSKRSCRGLSYLPTCWICSTQWSRKSSMRRRTMRPFAPSTWRRVLKTCSPLNLTPPSLVRSTWPLTRSVGQARRVNRQCRLA